ncbi:guanylate kinase [Clostridia bacterium]|nr:guanylate kinase [Clostridia bacterium]
MGKIFCLMGKSSSGKDTLYKALLKDSRLSLQKIIPYTTRPIRAGERAGEDYHFYTEQQLAELEEQGKIIELRAYDTVHGIWHYFTADDGQIDLNRHNYLYIATLEAYEKMQDYFGREHLIPLYLYTDDGLRLSRALKREKRQKEPKYAEMCRRYLADEEDFSEEKLLAAGIRKRFENTDRDCVIEELTGYITGTASQTL